MAMHFFLLRPQMRNQRVKPRVLADDVKIGIRVLGNQHPQIIAQVKIQRIFATATGLHIACPAAQLLYRMDQLKGQSGLILAQKNQDLKVPFQQQRKILGLDVFKVDQHLVFGHFFPLHGLLA